MTSALSGAQPEHNGDYGSVGRPFDNAPSADWQPLRVVNWFSHGAASAIATKLSLARFPDGIIATIDTGSEHEDNVRFRAECEEWFGREMIVLRSQDYADVDDVIERTRYLVGPAGARCTTELKKKVRWAFQREGDLHVWGYTADTNDAKRAVRFTAQNPDAVSWYPLVSGNIHKDECLALLERAGIGVPAMYELGYTNNNCIGCVKGGKGYWNKVRVDFPEVFARRARQERMLGRSVIREQVNDGPGYWAPTDEGGEIWRQPKKSVAVYLDELDPEAGRYEPIETPECGLDCQVAEATWQPVQIRGAA